MPWTCEGKRCGPCGRLHATQKEAKACCKSQRARWRRDGHMHFDRRPVEVTEEQAKRRKLVYPKALPHRII